MSAFLQSIYEFDLSVFSAVFAIGNDVLDTIMNAVINFLSGKNLFISILFVYLLILILQVPP